MTRSRRSNAAALALLLLASPASAVKTEQVFITFRPTIDIEDSERAALAPLLEHPFQLVVEDGLSELNRTQVGLRKWPVGRPRPLAPTTDLHQIFSQGLHERLTSWGLPLQPEQAPHTLTITLRRLDVYEKVTPAGMSHYTGVVDLGLSLSDASGAELWAGESREETIRFGRDESSENTSEVLGDSTLRALIELLEDPTLLNAWEESVEAASTPDVIDD